MIKVYSLYCALMMLLSVVSLYTVNVYNSDKLSSSSDNKRYATKLNNIFLANEIVIYTVFGVL